MRGWQIALALILVLLIGYAAGQIIPIKNLSSSSSSSSSPTSSTTLIPTSAVTVNTSSTSSTIPLTTSTSQVNISSGEIQVTLSKFNLSTSESLGLGGFILAAVVNGATVSRLNLTLKNTGEDEITSIGYGIRNLSKATSSNPLSPGSTKSYQLSMVVQGPSWFCISGGLACLLGLTPTYAYLPSPDVETIYAEANVTYSGGEKYSVPVLVPIFYEGGNYKNSDGSSFIAPSLAFPSLAKANSSDCASIVSGLRFSGSTLGNSGQSTDFQTIVQAPYQVLGVLGFYLEDPLNPSGTPYQTNQNAFTIIHWYGGPLQTSWSSLNVISGKTYIVVLQIGFATYLRTLTEMTATSTTYVPVGVVFSSGDYCSVSVSLQSS